MKNIFVLFGPSGSGQDSVIEGIAKLLPIERVITTVSRKMRSFESQGRPYYFISPEAFEKLIHTGALAEYVRKYTGIYYGVTKQELERVLIGERAGVWKVDFEGAITIKKRFPHAIVIMITAPLEIIEQRIRTRETLPEEEVQSRLSHIREWLPKSIYDYQVKNEEGKLDQTIAEVKAIIESHLAK
jgi:guanylate kinase